MNRYLFFALGVLGCGTLHRTEEPLSKEHEARLANQSAPLSEEDMVKVLDAGINAAKIGPTDVNRVEHGAMSTADRLRLIDELLLEHRRFEALRQIDSLPAVDDTASTVVARARLLVRAGRFQQAAELILAFVGNIALTDNALISTLAAAECGRGRPEAAAQVQGILYSDRRAAEQCKKVLSSLGASMP